MTDRYNFDIIIHFYNLIIQLNKNIKTYSFTYQIKESRFTH